MSSAPQTTPHAPAVPATSTPSTAPAPLPPFVLKVMGDLAAAMSEPLLYIGDRLKLFKLLAVEGPMTVEALANRTSLNARYLREWACAMVASEYLTCEPGTERLALPAENAPVLADEDSPVFLGGLMQMIPDQYRQLPRVLDAFLHGGGVPYSDYGEDTFVGTERLFRPGYLNFLAQQWIPAMPDVHETLTRGALVADVGCGRGQALLHLARAYPASTFIGFDSYAPGIEYAGEQAREHGLSDRVRYEVRDSAALPETGEFDLAMTCDCLHDMRSPEACARSIFQTIKPEGTWFCIEPNLDDRLENNIHPLGRLFYSVSTLQCMTCSLAHGGAGYGAGMGPSRVRAIAEGAGFTRFRKLPLEHPVNQFFEMKK